MDKRVCELYQFPNTGISLTSTALLAFKGLCTNIMSVGSGVKLVFTPLALASESWT